jgi:uncharacterized small protein (DUF1192 family)
MIVAILAISSFVHSKISSLDSASEELKLVSVNLDGAKISRQEFEKYIADQSAHLQHRVNGLQNDSLNTLLVTLNNRIALLDNEIPRMKSDQKKKGRPSSVPKDGIGKIVTDYFKAEVEIILLEQERDYLIKMKESVSNILMRQAGYAGLVSLQQVQNVADQALQTNENDQRDLKHNHPIACRIPGTRHYNQLRGLEVQHGPLQQQKDQADANVIQQKAALNALPPLAQLQRFVIQNEPIQKVLLSLNQEIENLEKRYEIVKQRYEEIRVWIDARQSVIDVINKVLPTACIIFLSLILAPIALKFMAYFVMAPMAARRPAIQILPDAQGNALVADRAKCESPSSGRMSAVSQTLQINGGEELLVHPEYLGATPLSGKKDTQWLLDWSCPLTSLASGMVALTRVRTTESISVVVSPKQKPLMEIGVISIHKGDALVLQPHNLVGVVQDQHNPLQITRHWRLGSLHAWLTLQLRYLVFHGPGRLIVEGCRGIRLEKADAGRSINQSATLGFSANLQYSTRRCETFWSYFLGKQELFNDYFDGSTGYYVYEESPCCGSRPGSIGRWFEWIWDSIRKVFGI